jgi:hypothetical protein
VFAKAANVETRRAEAPLGSARSGRLEHRRFVLLKKALKRAGNARRSGAIGQECYDEIACRTALSCVCPAWIRVPFAIAK